MKYSKILACLLTIPLCTLTAQIQDSVKLTGLLIGRDLGLVIEKGDRDRYRLFGAFEGYRSAFFFMTEDSSIYACISYYRNSTPMDSLVRFSPPLLRSTAQKIDQWIRISGGDNPLDPSIDPVIGVADSLPQDERSRALAGLLRRSKSQQQEIREKDAKSRANFSQKPAAHSDDRLLTLAGSEKSEGLPTIVYWTAGVSYRYTHLSDAAAFTSIFRTIEQKYIAQGIRLSQASPVQSGYNILMLSVLFNPVEFLTVAVDAGKSFGRDALYGGDLSMRWYFNPGHGRIFNIFAGLGVSRWNFEAIRPYGTTVKSESNMGYYELEHVKISAGAHQLLMTA